MTASGEAVFTAAATITIGGRTRSAGIEAMGGTGHQAEETTHHDLPFAAVGSRSVAVLEMMHQPVGHLVGNHLDQEGLAILVVQHRIEAQTFPPEVRLAGRPAAQVTPHPGSGQARMDLST